MVLLYFLYYFYASNECNLVYFNFGYLILSVYFWVPYSKCFILVSDGETTEEEGTAGIGQNVKGKRMTFK